MLSHLKFDKNLDQMLYKLCPREGNGNPLQYACLGNPMDRGTCWLTVHRVARVGHNLVTKATTKRENITQREKTKV